MKGEKVVYLQNLGKKEGGEKKQEEISGQERRERRKKFTVGGIFLRVRRECGAE